ncbi:MAG: hypothetical protein KDA27_09585 [Candidatus Eisenbacteria bacterium]|uniref:Uncharacterized protein n=1 Tax=Eiseniibacteriota bacterium TaxID=2212470 RepID=A0A956NBQ5_UNCEI|nr:hypothetical protein [Candidatus Eisenbacteria bacterium]MCB9463929.1 hypothetical protein [Candidatus Eisenbacteria bacterium]
MSGIERTQSNFNYQQISAEPEIPRESGWSKFGRAIGDVAGGVLGKLPIVGSSLSNMGIDPSFSKQEDLIRLQLQIQQQTQTFSTISNINKAKHDAAMTAVRNFK